MELALRIPWCLDLTNVGLSHPREPMGFSLSLVSRGYGGNDPPSPHPLGVGR